MTREEIQRVQLLFAQLQGALKLATLYPPNHPLPRETQKKLLDLLAEHLATSEHLTYAFVGGLVFVDGVVLPRESLVYQSFSQFCQEQARIGSLTFLPRITAREIEALVQLLNQPAPQDAASWDTQKTFDHIKIGPLMRTGREERELLARGTYRGSVQILREIQTAIQARESLDMEHVGQLRFLTDTILQQIMQDPPLALRLASIRSYDEYTLYHSVNVCVLSLGLGVFLGLPESLLKELAVAAIFHDVGKVAIPLGILKKTGPLDDSEWRMMHRHPVKGADILSRLSQGNRLPMIVAFEHQMQYDGQGYPTRVGEGWQQHPFSRIVAIADVYDAMTSRRPYRQGLPTQKVLAYLREEKRKLFDPDVVDVFELMLSSLAEKE